MPGHANDCSGMARAASHFYDLRELEAAERPSRNVVAFFERMLVRRALTESAQPQCELSRGTTIPATVRKIFHPRGRFETHGGKRFDICIMEIAADQTIKPPHVNSFSGFVGERSDTRDERLTIGTPPRFRGLLDLRHYGYVHAGIRERECEREMECAMAIPPIFEQTLEINGELYLLTEAFPQAYRFRPGISFRIFTKSRNGFIFGAVLALKSGDGETLRFMVVKTESQPKPPFLEIIGQACLLSDDPATPRDRCLALPAAAPELPA